MLKTREAGLSYSSARQRPKNPQRIILLCHSGFALPGGSQSRLTGAVVSAALMETALGRASSLTAGCSAGMCLHKTQPGERVVYKLLDSEFRRQALSW